MKKFIKGVFNQFGISIVKTKTYEQLKQTASTLDGVAAAKKEAYKEPEVDPKLTKTAIVNGVEYPYWLAPKTFNPQHPNYDANLAENFPGTFYNVFKTTELTAKSAENPLFQKFFAEKLMTLCGGNPSDYDFLVGHIKNCSYELEDDPDYHNFKEKYNELENFIAGLNNKYPGEYNSGGICEADGLFLYYAVRLLKPKVIVQTGTSNGVSCAHLALGLKHSGPDAKFYGVDMPNIYRPEDPEFHKQMQYGVLIPDGKKSAWLIPDAIQPQCEIVNGDSKELLKGVFEKAGKVDLFYHDSDHSYDFMWWEFDTAFPNMNDGGVIIADNTAWSSVVWDWARSKGLYSFNHRGSQGVVFF